MQQDNIARSAIEGKEIEEDEATAIKAYQFKTEKEALAKRKLEILRPTLSTNAVSNVI